MKGIPSMKRWNPGQKGAMIIFNTMLFASFAFLSELCVKQLLHFFSPAKIENQKNKCA